MRAGNFTFNGRYTLREINGYWYIYDRNNWTTTKKIGGTFKEAHSNLLKFKNLKGDL